ncbi:MAG: hypothetical protein M3Z01_05715 [Thermoproteota archaeon]|nr:hypothetical protein [Thermoproteota archaeon]
MKNPLFCDSSNRPYKNGKTFEDCKVDARKNIQILSKEIQLNNEVTWNHILEVADHDEIVYKLTLKYLREMGYNIGNYLTPKVAQNNNNNNSNKELL